jgi:hypothetical protein
MQEPKVGSDKARESLRIVGHAVTAKKKNLLRVDLALTRSSPFKAEVLVVIASLPARKEHDDASHCDGQGDEEL